jgi:hypothetical protein
MADLLRIVLIVLILLFLSKKKWDLGLVLFLGALLTGVSHAYVGISFPILLPIFGLENPDMVLVLFAYVSGFVGILLSPAHLCLVLALDFFIADLRDVYKILFWASVVIFIAAFLVLLFLRIV